MKAVARGEVWLVDLGFTAKIRPALVLSIPPAPTERALVTLVPHTTALRGSRLEVPAPAPFLRPGAFDVQGVITIPTAKLLRVLGRLEPPGLAAVEAAVRAWLGLGIGQE